MSSPDTLRNFWLADAAEAAYAAGGGTGGGTSAFDEKALQQADLLAIDRVIGCSVIPPKLQKEEKFDLGSNMAPSSVETKAVDHGILTLTQYLQSDDNYDLSISATNQGSLGTSRAFHIYNGITHKDLFGCQLQSLDIVSLTKDITVQISIWFFRKMKDGSSLTEQAYTSSAISIYNDVSATINAITSTSLNINMIKETITNDIDVSTKAYTIGDLYIRNPAIKGRTVDLEIDYRTRSTNIWGAFHTFVASALELIDATFFDATIVWGSFLTSTLTNITIHKDSPTNSGEYPASGFLDHKARFMKGVGFTIA